MKQFFRDSYILKIYLFILHIFNEIKNKTVIETTTNDKINYLIQPKLSTIIVLQTNRILFFEN